MNPKRIIKFSIRGIPVIPIFVMAVVTVAAVLVATTSVSTTVTIVSSQGTMPLYSDAGGTGLCASNHVSATSVSTLSYPQIFSGVATVLKSNTSAVTATPTQAGYFNTNLGFFCFTNPNGANLFLIPSSITVSGTLPAGSTWHFVAATGGAGAGQGTQIDGGTFCITPGSYVLTNSACSVNSVSEPVIIQVSIPATAPAGAYSWSFVVNYYSTATG